MSCLFICSLILSDKESQDLVSLISSDDGLLLIEDACYLSNSPIFSRVDNKYVLKTDLQIRGVPHDKATFEIIDGYQKMVELTLAYDKSLTWTS